MSTIKLLRKPTNEELETRRNKLDDILTTYKEDKKEVADKVVIADMQEHYTGYDRYMLHKDRLYIMANDHFVSEMSIFRYSDTVRTMFEDIDTVRKASITDFEHTSGFVRINAKKLLLETVKVTNDILAGKAMDVSIELLGKDMRKLIEENNKLKQRLELTDKSTK